MSVDDYLSGQRDIPTQAQLAVFHSSAYLKPQDYGVETPSLALHEREAGGRVSVLDQERLSGECLSEERPLLATGRLDGLSGRVFVVRRIKSDVIFVWLRVTLRLSVFAASVGAAWTVTLSKVKRCLVRSVCVCVCV